VRSVRVNILLPCKSNTCHMSRLCVCSLTYPTCKEHAPCYTVIRVLSCFAIHSHIIIQTARFSKIRYWKQNVCFVSTNLCEMFLVLRIIHRDVITNVRESSCNVPTMLVRFYWNFTSLNRFSKNLISSSIKFRSVVPCGEDRRTDRHDAVLKRA
jgi:hypothetical protein